MALDINIGDLWVIMGFFTCINIAAFVVIQKIFYDLMNDQFKASLKTFKATLVRSTRGSSSSGEDEGWGPLMKEIISSVAVNMLTNSPKVQESLESQIDKLIPDIPADQ